MTKPTLINVVMTTDQEERDITDHFRLLFDIVISSMDWGSGFLDSAEMLKVLQVGAAAGFNISSAKLFSKYDPDWEKIQEELDALQERYDTE